LDVLAWDFDLAEPRRHAVRGYFSPIADSMPNAALPDHGRIGSGSGFAVRPSTALRTGVLA